MKFLKLCAVCVIMILGLSLSGCGGGGAEVKSETKAETSGQTLGQELIDLKKAYEMGIISEGEYHDAKQKIIEKRTSP